MPTFSHLAAFALVALGMVLTPGPNMIYLVSRSIVQGRVAGLISLGGVALGFVFYMLCAAFGITALVFAVPYAYEALRTAGAAYLLWLAWQAVRPGGRSPFEVRSLPVDSPAKLFGVGLLTNLLNPKVGVFYISFLPQFLPAGVAPASFIFLLALIHAGLGLAWSAVLIGATRPIGGFLRRAVVVRWLDRITGGVFLGFGLRLALSRR